MAKVKDMEGLVLTNITQDEYYLIFHSECGRDFKMYHAQECCESVGIDDIAGDIQDLIGTPILKAEEVTNDRFERDFKKKIKEEDLWHDNYTWTFYKLATIKGYVDIRWFGESNGYYSEHVDFIELGVDYEY